MSSTFLLSAPLTAVRSSAVCAAWEKSPAVVKFGASGILGNAVFFGLDRVLFPLVVRAALRFSASNRSTVVSVARRVNDNAASVSFFVAYLLDIGVQHFLNALLVFGLDTISTRELYLASLATSYTAYFGTLCGSTILQSYLLQRGLSHSTAFWSTIALGSVVNYVVLTSLNAVSKETSNNDLGRREGNLSTDDYQGKVAMVPVWRSEVGVPEYFTNLSSVALSARFVNNRKKEC